MSIEQDKLKNIIEAALLAVAHPMSVEQLMKLFDDDDRPSANAIKDTIRQLQNDCNGRGVELKEVASGYRYQARQDYTEWLSRLWEERPAKYSRAALETLALIAYRQPVTRSEIEDVRGVGVSSSIIKTLIEREWIRVVGHRDVPGRPALYATTKQFLDYFNMKGLEELPTLAEIKDLDELNPQLDFPNPDEEKIDSRSTVIDEQQQQSSDSELALTDNEKNADEEQVKVDDELDDIHTEASRDTFYAQPEDDMMAGELSEQDDSDLDHSELGHLEPDRSKPDNSELGKAGTVQTEQHTPSSDEPALVDSFKS